MNLRENLRRSREVLGAYLRQGFHELGAALYGQGTAAQHPEYGMLHTKLPSEIAADQRPDKQLDAHLRAADERPPAELDRSRDLERE